jgi:hypothetical protein
MKKIIYKILFPPAYVPIITTPTSIVALALVFTKGLDTHPVSILAYVLSFYTLCILTAFFAVKAPKTFKNAKSRVYNTKYGNKYMTDIEFKTQLTLYISLAINLLNVGLNIIYGLVYVTNWFFILAFYYATLTVMRFSLALYTRKYSLGENILGEWKRARVCGAVLTLINLSLTGVVLMMMYQDRGFTYAGILIYVMAAYSFYHITVAIIDIIKYRKYKSPIINSIKTVKLAAALVSMLSLETAMLTSFGSDMSAGEKRIMIAATGAGISLIVIGLSSYMIVNSTNQINSIKEKQNGR